MTAICRWCLLCVLLFARFHNAFGQQSFLVEPSGVSILEGNAHTLQCSVSDKEGVVIWQKDGVPLNSDYILNNDVSGDIYEVQAPTNPGVEYNLVIKIVTSEEAGTYRCSVTAAGTSSNLVSRSAVIEVILRQTFSQTPSSREEKQSDTITMQCVARNKVGSLEWYRQDANQNLVKISTETSVVATFSERYSIIGNQDNGEYILQISNLQYSDAGQYSCHLTEDGQQGQVWSSSAQLTVIAAIAPGEEYPECDLVPDGQLSEGDNVTLICQSNYGDPPATLEWQTSTGITLTGVTMESTGGGQVRVDRDMILGREDNGAVFQCISSHVTNTETKMCQVGPLSVNLMQRIRVDIFPELIEVEEDDSATVTCNATAIDDNPDVIGFTWMHDNSEITEMDEEFTIETGSISTLHILRAVKSMDNGQISCLAVSPVDAQMAIASIRILEPTLFGLSYTLLAVVVAFVAAIIVAMIIIAIIIYCVWKKRRQKEEEEELQKIAAGKEVEQATVSAQVGSANETVTPYGRDNKYDYYIIKRDGRKSRHRSHKGRHNEVSPYLGNMPLDRSLPPLQKETTSRNHGEENGGNIYDEVHEEKRRHRRHHRRHGSRRDDDDDDERRRESSRHGDRGRSRRSRSESRRRRDRDDDYAKPEKRRSRRRRDRDEDHSRSHSEPPRRSSEQQRSREEDDNDERRRR